MSALLSLKHINQSFGPKEVLSSISLSINEGDRIALVGPNGCGKTTLIRILTREIPPDSGEVIVKRGLTIGVLPQNPEVLFDRNLSLYAFLEESVGEVRALAQQLSEMEELLSCPDVSDDLLSDYGEVQERFELLGGYTLDHRIDQVLEGLSLSHLGLERHLSTLSGGERTRLVLASLLLQQPQLLVLDEPTNHLDAEGIEWLETFIASYPHAVLVVSHDRHFLNRTVQSIVDFGQEDGTLHRYTGNYSDYLEQKELEWIAAEERYQEYQAELKQLKRLIKERTFSCRAAGKQRDGNKMAYDRRGERHQSSESRIIQQARMKVEEMIDHPPSRPPKSRLYSISFSPKPLPSSSVLRLEWMNKSVMVGERIVITGSNGSGKTTLLNRVANGKKGVHINPQTKFGYMRQDPTHLNDHLTVVEEFGLDQPDVEEKTLCNDLAKLGLIQPENLHARVGDLSIGQKQKLQLAKIIASGANVLLLDEPTNHLDLETLEKLEEALKSFRGVALIVSHDRWLIETLATEVWNLD